MSKTFGTDEPLLIEKSHYEELIKNKERVEILKRTLKEYGYIKLGEIKAIFEIEDESLPKIQMPSSVIDKCTDDD